MKPKKKFLAIKRATHMITREAPQWGGPGATLTHSVCRNHLEAAHARSKVVRCRKIPSHHKAGPCAVCTGLAIRLGALRP